jgi:hypothetical protein
LKRFSLKWAVLQPGEWKEVIEAIDLSTLQHLSFEGSNFSQTQFGLLVDRFFDQDFRTSSPLSSLNLCHTDVDCGADTQMLCEKLRNKVPPVSVLRSNLAASEERIAQPERPLPHYPHLRVLENSISTNVILIIGCYCSPQHKRHITEPLLSLVL